MCRVSSKGTMRAVGLTTEAVQNWRIVLTVRGMRSAVARLVVVAGLAIAIFVGSVAVGGSSEASAMPLTCAQALAMSEYMLSVSNVYLGLGDYQRASYYLGKADAYASSSC
jgi:hypothetical protein